MWVDFWCFEIAITIYHSIQIFYSSLESDVMGDIIVTDLEKNS